MSAPGPRDAAKKAGLKRYFTGEPCSRGHIAERITASGGCHQCQLDDKHSLRAEKPGYRTRAEITADNAKPMRKCSACGNEFPATTEHFVKLTKKQPSGTITMNWSRECRTCRNKRFKPFYKKNRKRLIKKAIIHKRKRRIESEKVRNNDRISARNSKRRKFADPKERAKETRRNRQWCKANPNRVAKFKWLQPDKRRYRAMLRVAAEKQATPPWLTAEHFAQMQTIYLMADRMSRRNGTRYDVDHYYPLTSKHCSGLHVPWNLQIITKRANQKKGNRLPTVPYRSPF